MTLNFENVDLSIKSFYDALPYGDYFSQVVHYESIDYEEKEIIKKYLIDNDLIKNYTDKNDGRYILTSHGENVYKNYGGIEKYSEYQQEKQKEKLRLEKVTNDKLHDDAKLSKWQVKAFPYVFTIGLIGGLYSIVSIFLLLYGLLFGESTEQKIERILESKLKAQPKIENTSIAPTGKKTESLKK